MQIIDGYTGAPNIYADDIGQYNISLFGSGDYVLPVGEQLGYELVSNNEIKIKDGFFITQGRRGVIKKGTTESCIIENGTQAENRNDLIIIEYAKDESSLVESHTLKVIKGTPGETAADPTTITGNIPNGAVLHQMPLYRVKLEGLNIVAVEPLFSIGKIAPETVDPMLATEEGFAADAMLTGNELKSLNSNNEWKFWKEVTGTEIIALPIKFAEIKVEVFFSNTYSYLFEIAYVQLKDDMRQYLTGYGAGGESAVCYLNMSKTQAYVSRVYNSTDVTATSIVSVYYR